MNKGRPSAGVGLTKVSELDVAGLVAAPLLSVVVPARNAAASIAATLRSLAEERDLIREILIVNDGSSDQTGALACDLGRDLDLPVKVISVMFSNAGATRNAGMRRAHGELLFLIDADDELITGGLRLLTEGLLSYPDADIAVGGYIRRMEGVVDKPRMPRPYGVDLRQNARDYLTNRQRSIAMGSAVIRRQALAGVCFPEDLAFDEDTIFWATLLSRARVVTVASPVLVYNVDPARMQRRFTMAPLCGFRQISLELDKLSCLGIEKDVLSWRKGWLARRIARALIRNRRYRRASYFLRLAAARHSHIRFSTTTLWYWAKIFAGSALYRWR